MPSSLFEYVGDTFHTMGSQKPTTCMALTMKPPKPPAGCKDPFIVTKPDLYNPKTCPPIFDRWECRDKPTAPVTMCVRAPCPQFESAPAPAPACAKVYQLGDCIYDLRK